MKKQFVLILFALLAALSVFSQEEKDMSLGGKVTTNNRMLYNDNFKWNWNENRVALNLEKKFSDKARFYTEAWFRSWGFPSVSSIRLLSDPGKLDPTNISLREAYVTVYGFIFKKLDVSFGRQRIAWGKGDRLNPTDNVNPCDLEDIWDFGRHLGSESLRLNFYPSAKWQLEGVFVPFFRPAMFPYGDMSSLFFSTGSFNMPASYNYLGTSFKILTNSISDSTTLPRNDISNSIAGIKIMTQQLNFDFSASYLYGRLDLPSPYRADISLDALSLNPPSVSFDIQALLLYPRVHIFGFDFAGNLGPVGLWGETAVFLPDSAIGLHYNYTGFPAGYEMPEQADSLILGSKPYVKVLLGADYFFPDNSYLNIQVLHGFASEIGTPNLNDYLMLSYSKKFLNEKLEVRPLNGSFMISDWSDIKNNYALVFMPEVSFKQNDNTEIIAGVRIIDGKGSSSFARLWDRDEIYFNLNYSF